MLSLSLLKTIRLMRVIESIFRILFLLFLLIARLVFWTAIASLPIIYFFVAVESIVSEAIITSIIVSFCYYRMMIWFREDNKKII